jgi:hypothetical protein
MEYYVYAYLDPSSPYYNPIFPEINSLPFYIGKGKNDRLNYHWKSILAEKDLKNIQLNLKLKSMKEKNISPIIIKIKDNLTSESANLLEKEIISLLGRRYYDRGILLNVAEGGEGGITWIGENPFKGKTLEELYGIERSNEMKKSVSRYASSRIGELNPMFGIRRENHPLYREKSPRYKIKHTEETRNKISERTKLQWKSMTPEDIESLNNKIKESKSKWSEEYKEEIARKISESNKNMEFTDSHKEKLSKTNHRKINKGNSELRLNQSTKEKISFSLKGRIFSDEHKMNLKKFNIEYDELEKMVRKNGIKSKKEYREWVIKNNIDAPLNPSFKSFKEKWKGWRYFLGKIKN